MNKNPYESPPLEPPEPYKPKVKVVRQPLTGRDRTMAILGLIGLAIYATVVIYKLSTGETFMDAMSP